MSVSAASKFFNKTGGLMVVALYDSYVRLPTTDEEWQMKFEVFERTASSLVKALGMDSTSILTIS